MWGKSVLPWGLEQVDLPGSSISTFRRYCDGGSVLLFPLGFPKSSEECLFMYSCPHTRPRSEKNSACTEPPCGIIITDRTNTLVPFPTSIIHSTRVLGSDNSGEGPTSQERNELTRRKLFSFFSSHVRILCVSATSCPPRTPRSPFIYSSVRYLRVASVSDGYLLMFML